MDDTEKKNKWRLVLAIVLLVVGVACGFLAGWFTSTHRDATKAQDSDPERIKQTIMDMIEAENIERNVRALTREPRLAGTEASQRWAQTFMEKGLALGLDDVGMDTYDALLSYPAPSPSSTKIQILNADGSVFKQLQTSLPYGRHAYHAYSSSGNITGDLVYANYATEEDLEFIANNCSIDLRGVIIMARSGWGSAGAKAKTVSRFGAKALLLFPDPFKEAPEGPTQVFPRTRWLPGDAVVMGTARHEDGDPLTSGYPAVESAIRQDPEDIESFESIIPVQPISYDSAKELFHVLENSGMEIPYHWKDTVLSEDIESKHNLSYFLGTHLKHNKTVNVDIRNELKMAPITNVCGLMTGHTEPDRLLVVGSHRDSWGDGALDPAGGTAVLMELVRVFGHLKTQGWRPRRTILFCSWDGEEFGLIGSTEWVEAKRKLLTYKAVAYLNLDFTVIGTKTLRASASPLLEHVIMEVAQQVPHPEFETVYDAWHNFTFSGGRVLPRVEKLRPTSDHTAFYHYTGVPSAYMYFADHSYLYYPTYHTQYDTFEYAKRFVDPDFTYHQTLGRLYGELIRRLADDSLIPFNLVSYAKVLQESHFAFYGMLSYFDHVKFFGGGEGDKLLDTLGFCIANFSRDALIIQRRLQTLSPGNLDFDTLRIYNDKLMLLERAFIDEAWHSGVYTHKHVLFSPPSRSCPWFYAFPGISDALCHPEVAPQLKQTSVDRSNYRIIQGEFNRVCRALDSAMDILFM